MTEPNPYTPPQHDPVRGTPSGWARLRTPLGGLGPLGLLLALAAHLMMIHAMRDGFDDRPDFPWWSTYFSVRFDLICAAFFGGLLALIGARGAVFRLLGLGAMLAALYVNIRTPL